MGVGRALTAPFDNSINLGPVSLKYGLHGSIAAISHPSRNCVSNGRAPGFHSEKNTLYPPANNRMGSDFFFHDSLLSAWDIGQIAVRCAL